MEECHHFILSRTENQGLCRDKNAYVIWQVHGGDYDTRWTTNSFVHLKDIVRKVNSDNKCLDGDEGNTSWYKCSVFFF